jgi:formylglycine-generating enzyme required for sulfatase activity
VACGNGACEAGESVASCPQDCTVACGNGECEAGENSENCPRDCGAACGNGECEAGESNATCPQDCTTACGNGTCEAGENADNCPRDCGAACGDGICEAGENNENCALDCGGACVAGEQRCNGADRQVCNPRGQFETVDCPGDTRCRETEGGDTECVNETAAICDTISRCCDGAFARNIGESCDDGLFCTSGSSCSSDGVCAAPVERDCDAELTLNECQTAACDETRDRCVAQATNEGAVCENADTPAADRCVDGACVASACECTGVNDCCDGCFVRNSGGSCDDGLFCTTGDTCSPTGQCVSGPARSCGGTPVGNCQTAVCDDEVDLCRAVSSADLAGSTCDDGLYCTVGETCTAAGACGGGRARDCSGIISVAECQANAACDDTADQCTFVAVNVGGACTAPDFCTVNATCTSAGACMGSPRDCASARTEPTCQGPGVCNSAAGRCEAPPINNGGVCDDGLLCTSGDRCTSGACGGSEIECGTATACRGAGICDEAVGTCSGTAQPNGTSCTITNGFGTCQSGDCSITTCRAGFANCDGDPSNGCETSVDSDPNNCGGCGLTCSGAQFTGSCTSGYCPLVSGTSWTYCRTPQRGDRPVNLANDDNNCGTCGTQCGALSECSARECAQVPLEFVRIPAGSFQMGSPTGELGRDTDEVRHSVTITRDFLMSTTEISQSMWQDLMNTNPALSEQPNLPMVNVNWWDALEFANTLSLAQGLPACYTLTGCTGVIGSTYNCTDVTVNASAGNPLLCTGYRLPTESEWEYSYRASTTTAFYNGDITESGCGLDANLDAIGWYCGNFGSSRSKNVGTKLPNAWGIYDMAGNVYEWCWDWYATYPGAVSDPLGPATGSYRVVRGGRYDRQASEARAAYRNFIARFTILPLDRGSEIGFRLARTAP